MDKETLFELFIKLSRFLHIITSYKDSMDNSCFIVLLFFFFKANKQTSIVSKTGARWVTIVICRVQGLVNVKKVQTEKMCIVF